ncbi:hypothetical protein ACQKDY_06695 [Alteromonas macleodii]|uniref:hypothetical protein n=1 Tax=Alteromonas macleodii TaxID=28108 RepID=UPI003D01672F
MSTTTLYQHSDNKIVVPIFDKDGVSIPASNFLKAEYVIARCNWKVKVKLTSDDGISVEDDVFVINIDDSLVDSEMKGAFIHQFVVWNLSGDKLPPAFQEKIRITKVIS